jgi:Tol biopolymer transport system component
MGEVYKARDTRLDRSVAIKVLPPEVGADPERQQRFEREARAIATLDHPHICPLYDVGQHDGVHYLVMQYLEGETLAAQLTRAHGPLPLEQALPIGIAMARALEKAHRAGITHRDLKPANIMLSKSGPKLLDFGLAKLGAPAGPISMSGMAQLATTTPGTAQGTILGTVQYMSPEQVEGKEADARSDIWALGAVLYEMTTGTRPFAGHTPASVIGAILRDVPPPVSTRQPLAPRSLDHLVERCLAKDPDERWQSAGDVGRVLQWMASNGDVDSDRIARPRGAGRERAAWIVATSLLLATLAFVTLWSRPVVPPGDIVRLSVNPPERTGFAAQVSATVPIPEFALSPDGRSITFLAAAPALTPTLWVRSLGDVDARQLQGTEDALTAFWSPDSRWIGFFDAQGQLKKAAVSGGTVQTIAKDIPDPRGASWGPDDTILFGTGSGGVYGVAARGGTPQPVTELDSSRQEGSHRWPQFLPDGRHFFFTVRSGLAEERGVYISDRDGKTRRLLIRSDVNVLYASPGYILYLDGDTLLGQPFHNERLELAGQPIPIAARVGRSSRGSGAFSVSTAGTLAYAGSMLRLGRLTWFDRTGKPQGAVGPDGERDYSDFRLSPDETRLAASMVDPKVGVPDVWLTDLVRGGTSRFTFGPALNAAPIWSPDGKRIAFRTNRKGLVEIYQKSAGAGDNGEPLAAEDTLRAAGLGLSNLVPSDWSSDGRYIGLTSSVPSDMWLLSVADKKPVRLARSPSDQMHPNFSPDVRFIAYTSNESGRFEVYVETLPLSDRKWPISTNGGYEPRWRADGREIYYLSEDRTLMAVSVSSGATAFGVPKPLFRTQVHEGVTSYRTHYVPSRDGSRFLMHVRSGDVAPVAITVVLNWTAGLKR